MAEGIINVIFYAFNGPYNLCILSYLHAKLHAKFHSCSNIRSVKDEWIKSGPILLDNSVKQAKSC